MPMVVCCTRARYGYNTCVGPTVHTAAWLCTHANNNCSNAHINICGLGFVSSVHHHVLLNDAQIKCVTLLNSVTYCSHRLADITHALVVF